MRYAKSKSYLRISLESQAHRAGVKVHSRVRRRGHNPIGAANQKVVGQRKTVLNDLESSSTIGCWDTEDVEGWLVEEGIGYFDRCGIFHYGVQPGDDYDYDPGARDSVDEDL
jgi:hypothetical protein